MPRRRHGGDPLDRREGTLAAGMALLAHRARTQLRPEPDLELVCADSTEVFGTQNVRLAPFGERGAP